MILDDRANLTISGYNNTDSRCFFSPFVSLAVFSGGILLFIVSILILVCSFCKRCKCLLRKVQVGDNTGNIEKAFTGLSSTGKKSRSSVSHEQNTRYIGDPTTKKNWNKNDEKDYDYPWINFRHLDKKDQQDETKRTDFQEDVYMDMEDDSRSKARCQKEKRKQKKKKIKGTSRLTEKDNQKMSYQCTEQIDDGQYYINLVSEEKTSLVIDNENVSKSSKQSIVSEEIKIYPFSGDTEFNDNTDFNDLSLRNKDGVTMVNRAYLKSGTEANNKNKFNIENDKENDIYENLCYEKMLVDSSPSTPLYQSVRSLWEIPFKQDIDIVSENKSDHTTTVRSDGVTVLNAKTVIVINNPSSSSKRQGRSTY